LGGTGGINHQSYDRSGNYIIVAASGREGANGRVLIVDASNYSLLANIEVGQAPHGVGYPGYIR
jgi:DNA-binding beta-propeller fold protein YncE